MEIDLTHTYWTLSLYLLRCLFLYLTMLVPSAVSTYLHASNMRQAGSEAVQKNSQSPIRNTRMLLAKQPHGSLPICTTRRESNKPHSRWLQIFSKNFDESHPACWILRRWCYLLDDTMSAKLAGSLRVAGFGPRKASDSREP